MKHPKYGTVANIYYNKFRKLYYVRFKRCRQLINGGHYKTIEEAIEAKRYLQNIVPQIDRIGTRKIERDKTKEQTWTLRDYLKDEAPEIRQKR